MTAFDAFDGFDKGPAAAAEFGRFEVRGLRQEGLDYLTAIDII